MEYINLSMPWTDWQQIVSDLENAYGASRDDIEILQNVVVIDIDDDDN